MSGQELFYKGYNLASDTIDTIILSGAGYYGLIYCGIIKYLEEQNLLAGIKYIHSVSAGTLFGLLIILGYKYEECIQLMTSTIEINKLININGKDILNLITNYGISDGAYLEEAIKHVLELKGFNPYITLEDLYKQTGIEFNLGITLVFKEKYELLNYKTRPDLPVWTAIRMSCSLPFIYYPVKDYIYQDYVFDGGMLNNTPVQQYLDSKIQSYINAGIIKHTMLDASTQTEDILLTQKPLTVNKEPVQHPKYRMNFICINIINKPQVNVSDNINVGFNDVALTDFITAFVKKLFYHQDGYQEKYKPYMLDIECSKYTFVKPTNLNLSKSEIEILVDEGYKYMETFLKTKLT